MGSIALLKAGIVGGFGFIIALGVVIALLTCASQSSQLLQSNNISVRKLSSFIILIIVWVVGWGGGYWYFSTLTNVNNPSDVTILIVFACMFTLTPSFSIVCAAFSYYVEVRKAVEVVNAKANELKQNNIKN